MAAILPTACINAAHNRRLEGCRIAFTTPEHYAHRLAHIIQTEGAQPIWCPTIAVEQTPTTRKNVATHLQNLDSYSGIAFTSRAGIAAVAEYFQASPFNPKDDGSFIFGCLGKDYEFLQQQGLFQGIKIIKYVVPEVASPDALVEELGQGLGRKILCPVPCVQDLKEPPVVPNFLAGLCSKGWNAIRVDAYVTKRTQVDALRPLVRSTHIDPAGIDALLFTSTAEVEGLLKGLADLGLGIDDILIGRNGRNCAVVAHGPVTAKGVASLGIHVDVIGRNFESFHGMIDGLCSYLQGQLPL